MRDRWKALVAAVVAGMVVTLLAMVTFYGAVQSADAPAGPLMDPGLGFLIYLVLAVLFFDWVSRQMGSPMKAAMTVALSQVLLVDVEYVLHGERGVAHAAASVVLLLGSWAVIGWVYGVVLRRQGGGGRGAVA